MQRPALNFPVAATLAAEATALVKRYPELSPEDVERLIAVLPRLPMLHLALMASDDELAPRLEAFQKQYRHRIRTPFRQYASFLIPVTMLVVITAWHLL